MEHHNFIRFFAADYPSLLGQSLLVYGDIGTLKSRFAATLATLSAIVHQSPALIFPVSEQLPTAVQIYRQTGEAWPLPYEIIPPIYYGNDSRSESLTGPVIRMHGISRAWSEIAEEIDEVLRRCPRARTVVIDSTGVFGRLPDRSIIRRIMEDVAGTGRLLILVGEESADPGVRQALELMLYMVDINIHLYRGTDTSRSATGLQQRWLRVEKARFFHHPLDACRLDIAIGGKIEIIPPMSHWENPDTYRFG